MADRYWVGGTNSWNATVGTKWATTSGGTGGSSVPTASDNAIFDANSGAVTVTINAAATCLNLDCLNGTGGAFAGTIAGSSTLAVSGTLGLSSGMTWTYASNITFNATSGTNTITSNGKTFLGTTTFNGVGGTWQLADAFLSSSTVTLTNGTFDTNGKTISSTTFINGGSATRTLKLNNSVWTLTGTGNVWTTLVTGFTLTTGGSSKLIINDSSASAKSLSAGTGVNYDDLAFTGGGTFTPTGSTNTWRDWLISSTVVGSAFVYSAATTVRNIDFTGFVGTWGATQSTLSLTGSLTMASGMTNSNTSSITFTDTSGTTRSITSAGKSFASAFTFNGVGGVWQQADAMITTGIMTLTNGTFSTNGQALQCPSLASSNSNTRTLTITNSTVTLVPTTTSTVWTLSTMTGLTFNSSGSKIKVSGTAGATYTIAPGAGITYNDLQVDGSTSGGTTISNNAGSIWRDISMTNSGSGNFTVSSTITCRNLDTTGATATFAGASAISMTGNLVLSSTTTASYTGGLTFTGTSGTQTTTTNGVSLATPITVNGVGGTLQLADALTTTSTITVTNGSLDFNGKNVSMTTLASSNSNTRSISFNNAQVTITGTSWNTTTTTGLTFSGGGASKIIFTNAGGSLISFNASGLTFDDVVINGASSGGVSIIGGLVCRDLTVSAGSGSLNTTTITGRNLDFTGFQGSWAFASGDIILTGNLTMSASMSSYFGGTMTFSATSGVQTITCNGVAVTENGNIQVNAPGATVRLADNLNIGNTLTLSAGTFDSNSHNIQAGGILSTTNNSRTLIITNCTLQLGVEDSGAVIWNTSNFSTLTVSASGSTINADGGIWSTDSGLILNDFVWNSTVGLNFSSFNAILNNVSFNDTNDDGSGYPFTCFEAGVSMHNFDMSGVIQFPKLFSSDQSISIISGNLNVGSLIQFDTNSNTTFIFTAGSGTQTISGTSDMSPANISVNTGATTIVQFNNGVSINNLNVYGSTNTVHFKSAATHIINGQIITSNASAGHLLTFAATTPGSAATLSAPGNNISIDYVNLTDITVTGGTRWFAGQHSVDHGGNHGWRFTNAAPRSSTGASAYLFI